MSPLPHFHPSNQHIQPFALGGIGTGLHQSLNLFEYSAILCIRTDLRDVHGSKLTQYGWGSHYHNRSKLASIPFVAYLSAWYKSLDLRKRRPCPTPLNS